MKIVWLLLIIAVSAFGLKPSEYSSMGKRQLLEYSFTSPSASEKQMIRAYLAKTYPESAEGYFGKAYLEFRTGGDKEKIYYSKSYALDPTLEATVYNMTTGEYDKETAQKYIPIVTNILNRNPSFTNYSLIRTLYFNIIEGVLKDHVLAEKHLHGWEQKLGSDIYIFDFIRGLYAEIDINEYEKAENYYKSALMKRNGVIEIEVWERLIDLQLKKLNKQEESFQTIRDLYAKASEYAQMNDKGVKLTNQEKAFTAKAFALIGSKIKEQSRSGATKQIVDLNLQAFIMWPCAEYITDAQDNSRKFGFLDQITIDNAQRLLGDNSAFYVMKGDSLYASNNPTLGKKAYEYAIQIATTPMEKYNAAYGLKYYDYVNTGNSNTVNKVLKEIYTVYPKEKASILGVLMKNSLKGNNILEAQKYYEESKVNGEENSAYNDVIKAYNMVQEDINKNTTNTFEKPKIFPTTILPPNDPVFSPDGKTFLISHEIWDVTKGRLINYLNAPFYSGGSSIKYSPDGKYILKISASGFIDNSDDGAARFAGYFALLINAQTGKLISQRVLDEKVHDCSWSPDSKEIVLLMSSGYIMKLSRENLEIRGAHFIQNYISAGPIVWSPNGREIIFIQRYDKGDIRIHDAQTLREKERLTNVDWPHAIAMSYDGKYLLVSDNERILHRWNRTTGDYQSVRIPSFMTQISAHPSKYLAVINNAEGDINNDGTVFDFEKMKVVNKIPANHRHQYYKYLSDSIIATWNNDAPVIQILDSQMLKETQRIEGTSVDSNEMFLDKGKEHILLYDKNEVSLWSVKTAQKIHTWPMALDNMIQDTENKNLFYSFEKNKEEAVSTLWQFNAQTKQQAKILSIPITVQKWGIIKGQIIVAGTQSGIKPYAADQGKIIFIDFKSTKTLRTLTVPIVTETLQYDNIYTSGFTTLNISPDGKLLAFSTYWQDGFGHGTTNSKYIRIINAINGDEIRKFYTGDSNTYVDFTDNSHIVSNAKLYSLVSGTSEKFEGKYPDSFIYSMGNGERSFKFDKFDISLSYNNLIFKDKNGSELIRIINKKNGEWLAYAPTGEFVSSEKGTDKVIWRLSDTEYADFDKFYETFYRPDLLSMILSEGKLTSKVGFNMKPAPKVEIINPPLTVDSSNITLSIKVTDNGGGIGQIRLYRNGSTVVLDNDRGLKPVKTGSLYTYKLLLENGANQIKVIAFNQANTMQSENALCSINASIVAAKPSLHAIIIGINEFKNPKLTLKNAVSDAKLFASTLKIVGEKLFNHVNIKLLTTKETTTKDAIMQALMDAQNINPNDLFIFYVASHGTVEEGKFFLITSNVGALSTNKLTQDALMQDKLKELVGNIPTAKKMVLLDTCYSGALGDALKDAISTRGLSEDAAIKTLNRAVGGTIISASTDLQEALEGYKNQGLFTYILAQGLSGEADTDKDGFIKTTELSSYIEEKVPEFAEEYFKRAQYPTVNTTGQGFPIGKFR